MSRRSRLEAAGRMGVDRDRAPAVAGETPPVAVSTVLVGTGGYGAHYLAALREGGGSVPMALVGAVDPRPAPQLVRLLASEAVPVTSSLDAFFAAGGSAELAVIASPIHWHVPQSVRALASGCHVLCDKPVGATIQEVAELEVAEQRAGRWVRVGYQWAYAAGVQALKRDILAGRFGSPVRAKTLCLWPRPLAYYRRSDWAGRLRDPTTGRWVLDSPLNNAQAHFAHVLLYLLGPSADQGAVPVEVRGEAYRVYPIESCDTVACRARTAAGVDVLFLGSHAVRDELGPCFAIELEQAVVTYDATPSHANASGTRRPRIVARTRNGRQWTYDSPDADHQFRKLFEAADAVRRPRPKRCGLDASRGQTLWVNGLHESVPTIVSLAGAIVEVEGDQRWVNGLATAFSHCYDSFTLPSEAGLAWSVAGRPVDVTGYGWFPVESAGAPEGNATRP